MKNYLRLFAHTVRHMLDFAGRATRAEFLAYIVLSQAAAILIVLPAAWLAPAEAKGWLRFAVEFAAVIPALALVVRRFHDFGLGGRWSLIMLAVALRSFVLELLSLVGGWEARSAVESPLAYVDWLLFLPFAILYLLLLAAPGTKGANSYGPDPRQWLRPDSETASPENPEPTASTASM